MRKTKRILEAEICPEHIHMMLEIPPKVSVSSFMGYLKGKSAAMLYDQFGELKYKYRSKTRGCLFVDIDISIPMWYNQVAT